MKLKRLCILVSLLPVIALAGLWLAGPQPLATGVYVQKVTSNSAVIARIDRDPVRLQVVLRPESQEGEKALRIKVAEDQPATVHAIAVPGLMPGRRYSYVLQELDEQGGSRDSGGGSFRTAPVGDALPVCFATVGDSGGLPWWQNMHQFGWGRIRPLLAWTWRRDQWDVAEWMAAKDIHFFLHLGDIVYWQELREAHEEAFFLPFAPVLEKAALFATMGNHDVPTDGSKAPFSDLFHHPRGPRAPAGGKQGANYSFGWGSVRFVVLDNVGGDWRPGSELRPWLEKTLAEASEPWLFVAAHVPFFSAYRELEPGPGAYLWPLFERHGVDLVFSGHDHHYVRFKPQTPGGPVQLIAGGGGKDLYDFKIDHALVAARRKAYGFLYVEARGLRLLAQAIGPASEVQDEFEIDRRRGQLPAPISPRRRTRILALRK